MISGGLAAVVVSDYQAVQELEDFGYASDGADAARLALTGGLDIEMAVQVGCASSLVESTFDCFGPQLLAEGRITMGQLNAAVRHVLVLKYLAGMVWHPLTDPSRVDSAELTSGNLAAAKRSADESQVLLQNNDHALPLSAGASSIAVVGPLADAPLDQLGSRRPDRV